MIVWKCQWKCCLIVEKSMSLCLVCAFASLKKHSNNDKKWVRFTFYILIHIVKLISWGYWLVSFNLELFFIFVDCFRSTRLNFVVRFEMIWYSAKKRNQVLSDRFIITKRPGKIWRLFVNVNLPEIMNILYQLLYDISCDLFCLAWWRSFFFLRSFSSIPFVCICCYRSKSVFFLSTLYVFFVLLIDCLDVLFLKLSFGIH